MLIVPKHPLSDHTFTRRRILIHDSRGPCWDVESDHGLGGTASARRPGADFDVFAIQGTCFRWRGDWHFTRVGTVLRVDFLYKMAGAWYKRSMQKVEVSRLRGSLLSVLDKVAVEGPLAITRHGRVIATLSGPPAEGPAVKFVLDRRRLRRLCRRHHIQRLALFGSILRDDFGPDSDVDVLVDPEPGCLRTLTERAAAEDALAKLFGRPIDFVKRHVIEASSNEIRKRSILSTARVIYEAA